MPNVTTTLGVAAILTAALTTPLAAQTAPVPPDPLVASIQDGAKHIRWLFTTAAGQMSEEDFAFRPTPEVRSFGQLLAHVAQSNYSFCATTLGEKAPGGDIEKTVTTRAGIQKALSESFAYCERAYAEMGDEAKARAMKEFRGGPRPALAVLNFRNYHGLLHWGNAITYMRLRGKAPPSA